MLLRPGKWVGKGSVLLQGMSLGETLSAELDIEDNDDGITITGNLTLGDSGQVEVSIRVVPNEVGTYTLDAFVGGTRLGHRRSLAAHHHPHERALWRSLEHLALDHLRDQTG